MKKIFIYYTLSGNGDLVAEKLKGKNITTRKIEIEDELPQNKFLRILTGGFLAGINHKSKLKNFDTNIDKYNEIIIGSPIWNGRLSCPINSVLDELNLKDKKLTFILYSGSGKSPKAINKINTLYNNPNIIELKEPKKNKEELKEKLKDI